jgi:hypothetical protein
LNEAAKKLRDENQEKTSVVWKVFDENTLFLDKTRF